MSVMNYTKWSLIPLICFALIGCDVVKLDQNGKPIIPMTAEEAASLKNLTAEALAEKFWGDILQEANALSKSIDQRNDNGRNSAFVRISGVVGAVDDSKKAATMTVDTGSKELLLQIGPIIRGNSIRDAASFINFDDFKNQVQFARLSKELNKKAMENFTRPDSSWKGSKVDVLAAVTYNETDVTEVIPLEIVKR
ncbi:DUF2291 family protein [Vibrio ziniensis]|uniref:DUF2291 domain-containing protein n=1 Tax=Vibrio ziniensis TaxID=2711221 RepID=A0A6G7CQM7_9VIBR|nr:DUF2291 family protein [Vibrio ziniensis]QIH44447.1 DUF2291 domain-containing protein [Vibrio ziniensis]